jgi:hypothetical protein
MSNLQVGNKVKVIKGDYKGAEGTVTTVLADSIVVTPNENADSRAFHPSHVKKIEFFSNEEPKTEYQTEDYREANAYNCAFS